MAIDLIKKSNRLLAGRRYTTDVYTDSQESFTSVFDLNSTEIYTQTSLIPTASLPFSGSSQNGYYYTAAKTISPTATGNDIMRYWYRHPLTKSDLSGTGDEVWMFISGSPTLSTGAQLIDINQQTGFISPKYSIASISTNHTELSTPGYVVKAVYSADGIAFTDIDASYYSFDYKTGILQFSSSAIADSVIANQTNGRVYLSAYQYVGETLFARLNSISSSIPVSASYAISSSFAVTASYINPLFISASAAAYGFGSGGGGSENPWVISGDFLYTRTEYNIQATGSFTVNGHERFAPDIFIVKRRIGGPVLFKVTDDGVQFTVNTSNPSTNPSDYGQIYFTSQSVYLALD